MIYSYSFAVFISFAEKIRAYNSKISTHKIAVIRKTKAPLKIQRSNIFILKRTFIEIRGIRYNICFVTMTFNHTSIINTIKVTVIKSIAIHRRHSAVFSGFVVVIEKILFLLMSPKTHHKINRTIALPPLVSNKIC